MNVRFDAYNFDKPNILSHPINGKKQQPPKILSLNVMMFIHDFVSFCLHRRKMVWIYEFFNLDHCLMSCDWISRHANHEWFIHIHISYMILSLALHHKCGYQVFTCTFYRFIHFSIGHDTERTERRARWISYFSSLKHNYLLIRRGLNFVLLQRLSPSLPYNSFFFFFLCCSS